MRGTCLQCNKRDVIPTNVLKTGDDDDTCPLQQYNIMYIKNIYKYETGCVERISRLVLCTSHPATVEL